MSLSKPQNDSSETPYERKTNPDGSPNARYVDLLDEDPAIAGQKFACMSFVSPERILKSKSEFLFQQFLNTWDMNKSLEKFTQFTNFLAFKYKLDAESVQGDLKEFVESEEAEIRTASAISDDYKNYIERFGDKLNEQFDRENKFCTSTRGVKVRGVFATQEEAEMMCKKLREIDPSHDVYVGSVGMWMPFHPEAYKTGKVEYLEDELNQLMKDKKTNEDKAKLEFEARIRETKAQAIEDNTKKAMESGNLLTQTLTNDGNLVNVKNITEEDMESRIVAPDPTDVSSDKQTTSANVAADLFAEDNIATSGNYRSTGNYSID
jgi:hypothetical protein